MFEIGQQVKVLPPFDNYFTETYTIQDIFVPTGGQPVNVIDGGHWFDNIYLEAV
jgi:hypothetical protein